jgi:hypothetical protein
MRSVVFALALAFCAVPLRAQPPDQPVNAEPTEQGVETVPSIIQYPRTIDAMARLWMALYDACEAAQVPAESVTVINPEKIHQESSGGNVVHLDSAGQRMPTTWFASPRAIELGVEAKYFAPLVEGMVKVCGQPYQYVPLATQLPNAFVGGDTRTFCAEWCYCYAWPDTYELGKGKFPMEYRETLKAEGLDHKYEMQQIRLSTTVEKDGLAPELTAVTQKYGVIRMPVR